jgi:magnesium transporter
MAEAVAIPLDEYRQLHPADLADRLQRLATAEAQAVLQQLPRPLAAAALHELDKERALELLAVFEARELAGLFSELPPEAVADLAAALPPRKRRAVLAGLPAHVSGHVQALLRYPADSAGGIMSESFVMLREDQTVQQCLERLRSRAEPKPVEVSYLYVTDDQQRLTGVVPLRELVFAPPDRRAGELMNRGVRSLRVTADQEEIARQFEHYHFLALPVLDGDNRLIGVVKASDALEIASAEATEDMQLMVGLSGEERALTPWRKAIGRRLPWLFVNLVTAFLAGAVVDMFQGTIAKWTALAVFLPIIAGQGGNAGMQTLTIVVRDLALGELSPGDGRKALGKELMLGLLNGLAIGLVAGAAGYLWQGSFRLGLVATLAMILNLLAAALAGVTIPLGLKSIRVDPALASSIFLTTVTDVAGFFFFLGLATLVLRLTGA